MKIMHSRARRLKITISIYSPARGSRSSHHARENFWSKTKRVGSGHLVLGRSTVSLL